MTHCANGFTQALTQFNRDLPRNPHVHLSTPAANEDRRLFAVAPLSAQPEPQSLGHLKDLISQRYGMLDLLDIVLEADRAGRLHPLLHAFGDQRGALP